MRQSLMNSFDEIYLLDLHGNSLKKERAPDGSEDNNVFDIQQGVAIALLIKHRSRAKECKIYHSDLWGIRDDKYDFLHSNDFHTVKHTELKPSSPFYFFVPLQEKHKANYEAYPQVNKVFPIGTVGVVTGREHFTISLSTDELWPRMLNFAG